MWTALKFIFRLLVGALIALALFFLEGWIRGQQTPNAPTLFSNLYKYRLFVFIGIPVSAALARIAFQRERRENLKNQVMFYKTTSRLLPTDFVPVAAWYDSYFIPRLAVSQAVTALKSGQNILLTGIPLIGKTRCALEALKKLSGYHVLGLSPDRLRIPDLKLPRSWLVLKPKLILFLDDLQKFVDKFSPELLLKRVAEQSRSVNVLSTCRSGKEFDLVQQDQALSSLIARHLKVVNVQELSKADERLLAAHFDRPWTDNAYNGAPGSIVFDLSAMRQRLEESSIEARTLMRSLSLLRASGIQTYRRALVDDVARSIYELQSGRAQTDSAWHWLQNQGFLSVELDRVLLTHSVYVEPAFYEGYEIIAESQDLARLWQIISSSGEPFEVHSMALGYYNQRDLNRAESALRRYLELVPRDAVGHSNLGGVLSSVGRTEEAEAEYRAAIGLDSRLAAAHYNLANLLAALGRNREAEAQYREAILFNPALANAHYNLANLLTVLGRDGEAETEYRVAIRYNPKDAGAHLDLGNLLFASDKVNEAEAEYREAIQYSPESASAHHYLAVLLRSIGRDEEADAEDQEANRLGLTTR